MEAHDLTAGYRAEIPSALIRWLLEEGGPWVRYRTRVDLLGQSETDPLVLLARHELLQHPRVQQLIVNATGWPGYALTHHNDAKHLLHLIPVLAEFGIGATDVGMDTLVRRLLAYQSPEGALQTQIYVPRATGGNDAGVMSWMICDTPTLLYTLLKLGMQDHPAVQRAIEHLLKVVDDNGWRCIGGDRLGKVLGIGRKADPCPYATLIAVKALACLPLLHNHPAMCHGVEMLLSHWEHQHESVLRLFGIGTDFHKLKYPFIWYDILHVVETLSQIPWVQSDLRFREMVREIQRKHDEDGRYTPESIWMAWKDWDFGQKRQPSPWLTFLVLRMLRRVNIA